MNPFQQASYNAREVWDIVCEDEPKRGRPRKGEDLRVTFSARIEPQTAARLTRNYVKPSHAVAIYAAILRAQALDKAKKIE